MEWNERCEIALEKENMFHSPEHRTRFRELLDCYSGYAFFSKGLCKCMYLSAWDEEHFAVILEILNDMALSRERDTDDMEVQGGQLADEYDDGEAAMYRLSGAFLAGIPFPEEKYRNLPENYRELIRMGLKAAKIIDGTK